MIQQLCRALFAAPLALILFLPILVNASPFPDCSGPGCIRVATPEPWPQPIADPAFEIVIGDYLVRLPEVPRRITQTWDGELVILGQDGIAVSLSLVQAYSEITNPEVLDGIPKKSSYSIAEAGQILFTKTINDPFPATPEDLFVWRQAMFLKTQAFGESNPVLVSKREGMKAYYFEPPMIDNAAMAYAFYEKNQNSYLRIQSLKIPFDVFKVIVGSLGSR